MNDRPGPDRGAHTPIVAIDVDGVLNPHNPHRAARLGYQAHRYTGPDPHGQPVTGTVWLHPAHGPWLRELATHAQPVWCTSWDQLAASWIAPRLGLPDTWPHVPVQTSGVRFGHQSKLDALYTWAGHRPVAVLDDEFGGKDADTAARRTAEGAPTLLRPVDPQRGLCRDDINTIMAWLDTTEKGTMTHAMPPRPDQPEEERCQPALSVGDPVLGKTRLLSQECATCIFKPGNLMHLTPGRLRQMVAEARSNAGYIICHSTLPYAGSPVPPAICRGFAERYHTWQLQVMQRLWGFVEVPPPDTD